MAGKGVHYYLIKVNRFTGWLLFFLVGVYLITGFSLCGMFGFNRIISAQGALVIHKFFDWPLVISFLVHSVISMYYAFRRWGWIGSGPVDTQ